MGGFTFSETVLVCRCAASCHLPILPHRRAHGHNMDSWKVADAGIHQPWVDSRSVKPSWSVDVQRHVICLSCHIVVPMGMHNKDSWKLVDAGTHQPWVYSLRIKFIGIVLACRCARSRSFALWGHAHNE